MHVMRLRNPWELSGSSVGGRVVVVRRFGRPTNLEPHERVALVLEGLAVDSSISFNGRLLGQPSNGRLQADVTDELRARNELAVDAPLADDQRSRLTRPDGRADAIGTLVSDVRIEIFQLRPNL